MKKMIRDISTAVLLLAALALPLLATLAFPSSAGAAALINGAGATFPYPLYSRWAYDYNKLGGVKLNYQAIGSGGGIKQIQAKTVDFGASDAPMKAADLKKHGLFQFPMAIGGVVPVVNIKGVGPGDLRLTGGVLAAIYSGRIRRWDDKRIAALNPDIALPKRKITVVHRSDGSGTTWIFTNYLDKVSTDWHKRVGFAKAVKWPVGVGGKGNAGVATYVKRVKNSIGYVEFAYATQNKMSYIMLKNRSGRFVGPTIESFKAAAKGADWKNTPGFAVVLTNQKGAEAWPIAGATFIIVYKRPGHCGATRTVLEFFDWAYRNGAEKAVSLDYVPIPKAVYGIVEQGWSANIRCKGERLWK